MKEKVLFIAPDYVKQFTSIPQNVDDDKITIAIQQAQIKYILTAIGRPLYDYLVNNISLNNGVSGLTENYYTLLTDYITPALTEWTIYTASLSMAFSMQNKGVGRINDQYLQSAPLDELIYLRNELRNSAEWHQKRLQKYLSNSKDLYPEYTQHTYDLSASKDAGKFFSGLSFDKNRRNRIIDMYSEENPNGYYDV